MFNASIKSLTHTLTHSLTHTLTLTATCSSVLRSGGSCDDVRVSSDVKGVSVGGGISVSTCCVGLVHDTWSLNSFQV